MDLRLRIAEPANIRIDMHFDPHNPPFEPAITDQDRARGVLAAGIGVLDRLAIPYCLADGAVLGWLRHGRFIDGDTDIDIAVDVKDYRPEISAKLQQAGFTLLREEHINAQMRHQQFMADGYKFDIAYLTRGRRKFRNPCPYLDAILVYLQEPHGRVQRDFMGLTVWMPEDPDAYVAEMYGPDWRVPTTQWHWAFCINTLKAAIGPAPTLEIIARDWLKWQQIYQARLEG